MRNATRQQNKKAEIPAATPPPIAAAFVLVDCDSADESGAGFEIAGIALLAAVEEVVIEVGESVLRVSVLVDDSRALVVVILTVL